MTKEQIAQAVADGLKKAFKTGVDILDSEVQSVTAEIVKLIEDAPLVYGTLPAIGLWKSFGCADEKSTHSARLICIEPIVKECTRHEPLDKFIGPLVQDWVTVCKHCSVELYPEWKVK